MRQVSYRCGVRVVKNGRIGLASRKDLLSLCVTTGEIKHAHVLHPDPVRREPLQSYKTRPVKNGAFIVVFHSLCPQKHAELV